jgi:hypothetical protein
MPFESKVKTKGGGNAHVEDIQKGWLQNLKCFRLYIMFGEEREKSGAPTFAFF